MEEQKSPADGAADRPLGRDIRACVDRQFPPQLLRMERYIDAVSRMVKDAEKDKALPDLCTVLVNCIAELIVKYGAVASGHVLERLGLYIARYEERRRAAEEVEEARLAGKMPN